MRKFKRFTAVILVLTFIISLSGCSFRFSSFDSLLRPPKAIGKYQGLQEAFEKAVTDDYILFTPEYGEYKSAFLTFDIDSDGDEDAIVFYALKNQPETAKIYCFTYEDNVWTPVCSADGAGSSVNTVMFSDLNMDKTFEIIVGWNILSGKTNKSFVTYIFSDSKLVPLNAYPYNYLTLLDVNGDGNDDIFTMTVDSTVPEMPSGYARVYNYNSNTSTLDILSETRTDGNVSGYISAVSEKNGDVNYIYVEATKGEKESITELLYWDDKRTENKLVSPLFDFESQTTKSTWRNINISSFDINNDGLLEIPVSVNGSSFMNDSVAEDESTSVMSFIKWVKYRKGYLSDVQYSIVNGKEGYILKIPSSWVERILVKESDGQIDAYRWMSSSNKTGDLLFSIYSFSNSDAEKNKEYSAYKKLGSAGDTDYVYRVTDAGYAFGVKDRTFENDFILKDFG